MKTLNTDSGALAAAFTEWHRRWVEEPARFLSESESLGLDSDDYGEQCAAYLIAIIDGDL